MVCLREEIEPLDTIHSILPPSLIPQNVPDISSLGMGITGNVDDSLWGKIQKLVQEHLVAALPRRIDDERGLRAGEIDFCENGLRVAFDESCVLDVVRFGVIACGGNTVLVDVDANNFLETLAACDGEETAAAVCVDKVFGSCSFDGGIGVANGFDDGEVEVITDVVGEL